MAQSVKADAGINIGQVFQGKYRVEAILGHGGMGVVAECTHLALNERVAVKMLRQDVLTDSDAVSRFVREAQAAAKLKSEYVARVSDVGTFENGVPYMVMEFLEGHDLGELLKQRGVLSLQWAVEIMLQTCEALAEAHSLAIVHRDVKPTNLFVTWRPDGSALIKVLDFGISKSPMGTDMQLTQTQSLLGTPAYMSPEQMRSARLVDTRTDIWSLGTVFYEILEGRRPFEAESFSEMCVKVAVDPPQPMEKTPPGLQQVIMRCLAKSPEQRYASMAELAQDLVPYSADPHNAQLLVERMTRMLRRAPYEWDVTASGRIPMPAELGPSARGTPIPTPHARNSGSELAAAPLALQTLPPVLAEGSVVHDPGPTYDTLRVKPRRWPLLFLVFSLAAAIAAVVVFVVTNGGKPGHLTPAASQAESIRMPVVPSEPPPEPAPEVVVPVAEPPPAPAEAKPIEAVKAPAVKPATRAKKTAAAKASPKREVKAAKAAPPEAPPAPKKCNAFGSMHGC